MSKTNSATIDLSKGLIIIILLLEGASVMFVELAAARIIAPFYGASLTTWASVLGVTMSSLAVGYFMGGKLADRSKNPTNLLFITLFLSGIATLLLPYFGKIFMFRFSGFSLEANVLLLSILLLSPALLCFGTVPQIVIKVLSENPQLAGETTGLSYAISTVGGIAGTFIMGFLIVPLYGVSIPLVVLSVILVLIPAWFLLIRQKNWGILIYLPLLFLVAKKMKYEIPSNSAIQVQEHSEGLLGQLMVADYPYNDRQGQLRYNRMLMINRMPESTIDPQTYNVIYGEYIHTLMKGIDPVPDNSDVLLLGLGAGNLVKQFQKRNFNLDVCELDARIAEAAFKYFGLQNDFNLTIDDARHYLNNVDKKYDLIVFDVFKGENPPAYLLSKENIDGLNRILNPNGVVAINFNGFLTGDIGKSGRSVIKTILNTDFNLRLFTSKAKEEHRNMIMILSKADLDYSAYQNSKVYAELNTGQYISDIRDYEISISSIDTSNALVLTDNMPILDILNQEAATNWRNFYNSNYTANFAKTGIPMFK